jgi:CRP-like cAMP-binding protein
VSAAIERGGQLPAIDPVVALGRSPVLAALGAADRAALVAAGREQRVRGGSELFRAGDPCPAIQVLLSGRVRLWRLTEDGHVLVLRRCGPGEVFGQMAALDDSCHSVHASADEPCRLLAIPAPRFRALLAERPAIALRLAIELARRVRSLSDELEAMKFASIGERVLRRLGELARDRRELRLTHQALADQVGASRENVSRVLGLLRDQGLIALGRGRIAIVDPDGLAKRKSALL